MRKLLIVALLLAGSLVAQPTTTTVADTLRLPDVSNITGTVYIRLSHPCEAGDGSRIYSGYPGSAPVTAGAFTVNLVPNDNCADVAGNHSTAYKVQYDVRDASGVKQPTENETWVVPTSGSTVTISDVVTTTWTAPVNYLNLGRLGNYSTKGGMLASNGSAWARLAPDADNYCLVTDSTTSLGVRWGSCASGTGVGTVTSVGVSAPSTLFAVSGSPVTTAGTLALSFAIGQTANRVFGTSAAGAVSLLALTADHLPDLSGTYQPLDAALTALAAGSDFFQVTGPTTSTKVFTLPDANATLLYSGGALGTPSGGTLTNATGLPIASGVSGLGAGVATFLATPSSENLAAAVTGETGTGAAVFATSPTLVTPTLGVATATSINKVAITAPATGSTLTVADGKTLTVSNTITFTGTDSASVEVGTGGTVAMTADKLSAFAATTSAELSSVLSDENPSGGYVTNPMLTAEDIIVGSAIGVPKRLAKGSEGQALKVTSGVVAWSTDSTGGTPAFSDVASGTNTAAAMVVGTGASLATSGSGTIAATSAATATTAGTASALAANGANCSAGQYPLGVDASGAAESCTVDNTGTDDQVASEVPVTPVGSVAATDVQAAIQELDSEKLATTATAADSTKLANTTPGAGGLAVLDDATTGAVLTTIGAAASGHDHSGVYEPNDADLTAIAALACTADQIIKRNGVGAWICAADATGGTPAFSGISAGTNTSAAMVVGTGASLATSGSGTIAATTSADSAADDISNDNLGGLQNVTEAIPANDEILQYVIDHWENQTLAEAGIQAALSLATGVETWLGTPSSANLAAALTDEVGNAGGFTRGTAGLTNECVKWDVNGNLVSAGAACGTGGGTPGGVSLDYQFNNAGAFGGASLKECAAGLIGIGGCTSAFPALKRSGAATEIRGGDDIGYAPLVVGQLWTTDYFNSVEITTPLLPAADQGRLYFKDNGVGKTVLCYLDSAGLETCPEEAGASTLPTQTGNENKLLSTNGTVADWRNIGVGLIVDASTARVDDSTVVMRTGAQSVAGDKTFSGSTAFTGAVDVSGGTVILPGAASLPATCTASKEIYVDTDATPAGQQVYLCNAGGNGWNLVGDGGGAQDVAIQIVIDGGGAVIATGIHGDIEVPFACTISKVTGLADQSGSIVVDIWKDVYANYPPTVIDSITAAAPLTLSAAIKAQDSTLTGWTTAIAAGDTLRYNVNSAATITRLTVSLTCAR